MASVSFVKASALVALAVALVGAAFGQTRVTAVERAANGKDWVFDFTSASWASEIKTVIVSRCSFNGSACAVEKTVQSPTQGSVTLVGPGFYEVKLLGPLPFGEFTDVEWIQFVPAIEPADGEIRTLASRHAPLLSFHPDEKRFPVSARELFSDFFVKDLKSSSSGDGGLDDSETLASALAYRGSSEHSFFIKKDLLKTYNAGERGNLPVYWYHEYNGDKSRLFITYALIYSYDYKGLDPSEDKSADHGLDRESIAVEFSRIEGQWLPRHVYYAGHLETQPTYFLGCTSLPTCDRAGGRALLGWTGGRVRVSWGAAARRGDRPIAYVARGSHAMFPAAGWYNIDNEVIPDLTEPAGDTDPSKLAGPSRLIELDLDSEESRMLAFSGYVIDGFSAFANSRITPHIRFPAADWSASAQDPISGCTACGPYIYRLDAPVIPYGASPDSVSAAAGTIATFVVEAVGSGPLEYQWRRDGIAVPCSAPGNCSRLDWSVTAGDDGAKFDVVVSNAAGSVTSNAATLSVVTDEPPGPTPDSSPNLSVASVSFGPSTVVPMSSIDVSLSVVNRGPAAAAPSTAVIRVTRSDTSAANPVTSRDLPVPALAAGSSVNLPITSVTAPASPGSYYIWVVLDNRQTSGQLPTDESDDLVLASGTLTVTQPPNGGPDLVVQSLTHGSGEGAVPPGGKLPVRFIVANTGPDPAAASKVALRVNASMTSAAGTDLVTVDVPPLAVGAAVPLNTMIRAELSDGTYQLWAVADVAGTAGQLSAARENDEARASRPLTVADASQEGADLVPKTLAFDPPRVTQGGLAVITFEIHNRGAVVSRASTAAVRINAAGAGSSGVDRGTVFVPELAPGASRSFSAAVPVSLEPGPYRVWVEADASGAAGQVSMAAFANDAASAAAELTVAKRVIPPGATAEGTYSGAITRASSNVFRLLVLEDGEFWGLYGIRSGGRFGVFGFMQGTSTSADGSFSSTDLRDFGFVPSAAGSATATYDAATGAISGQVTTSRGGATLTGGVLTDVAYEYHQAARLVDVQGAWGMSTSTGDSGVIDVQADGRFETTTQIGCRLSGSLTPRASGKNVFDVLVSFGSSPCVLPGQTARGIAVVVVEPDGRRQLTIVTVDATRSVGLIAAGYR